MADIILEVDESNGDIKVEGVGFTGGQCVKDIEKLQELLGLTTTSQRAKPELVRVVPVQRIKR